MDPARLHDRGATRTGWDQFPWLTVVLGSGCLDLPDANDVTPETLAAAVGTTLAPFLATRPFPDHGGSYRKLAENFTRSLARDRMGSGRGQRPSASTPVAQDGGPDNTPPDEQGVAPPDEAAATGDGDGATEGVTIQPVAAQLALVAALLSRFYHLASAASAKAMSRGDDDIVEFNPTTPPNEQRSLMRDVVDRVLDEMDRVRVTLGVRLPADDLVVDAVKALLDQISMELRGSSPQAPRRLRLEHLRLVSEVSWHFLVLQTPVYPGWTELLLALMLSEALGEGDLMRRARPRFFDLAELPRAVSALLNPATERSWAESQGAGQPPSARDRFYGSAAQVLWAQAEAIQESNRAADGPRLPPSVAFVTSFDLELEMALWKAADGRPFAVAVPVHLLAPRVEGCDQEAEFCWLLGHVQPRSAGTSNEQLHALRTSAEWHLLTPAADQNIFCDKPVVVHLSGCPLLTLPVLSRTDPATAALIADFESAKLDVAGIKLSHAVTVDEYLALRQAAAELSGNADGSGGLQPSPALPFTLTIDGAKNRRFWMAMGVPIADSAVRHRMVSQITLRRMQAALGGVNRAAAPQVGPATGLSPRSLVPTTLADVEGLAVNLRVNDEDASLLYWVGLDVVEADCHDFADDLRHYAAHVRDSSPLKRPGSTGACVLTP